MNTRTFYSTDFEVHGISIPAGVPLVVDASLQVVPPILLYIWNKCFRYTAKPILNTARAYTEDLRVWWDFLRVRKITWMEARFSDLQVFISGLVKSTNQKTGRRYADQSNNRRIGTVINFYRYAFSRNWPQQMINSSGNDLSSLICETIKSAEREFFERRIESEFPKRKSTVYATPLCFWPVQYRALANRIGPLPPMKPPAVSEHPAESVNLEKNSKLRNRLWSEMLLHVGLRPGEPAEISIHEILSLSPQNPNSLTGVTYFSVRNKGGGTKRVRLPNFLLNMLICYIENAREDAIKDGIRRGHYTKSNKPSALFLNSEDAGRNSGLPMKPATFYLAFKTAAAEAERLGLHVGTSHVVERQIPNANGELIEKLVLCHPHMLRHTFAIWNLLAEKRSGNREPYKAVSSLLGHKSVETTIDKYMRAFDEYERQLSDRVVESIYQIIDTTK